MCAYENKKIRIFPKTGLYKNLNLRKYPAIQYLYSALILLTEFLVPNIHWYPNLRVDSPGYHHSEDQNELTVDDVRAGDGWTTGRYGNTHNNATICTMRGDGYITLRRNSINVKVTITCSRISYDLL